MKRRIEDVIAEVEQELEVVEEKMMSQHVVSQGELGRRAGLVGALAILNTAKNGDADAITGLRTLMKVGAKGQFASFKATRRKAIERVIEKLERSES